MWLVSDLTAADSDDPSPGTIIAGRIEADDLAAPFQFGALLVQVLDPDAEVFDGLLYILDDGSDVAVVRMRGESADLWMVEEFRNGSTAPRRRALARRRWQPRALLMVK